MLGNSEFSDLNIKSKNHLAQTGNLSKPILSICCTYLNKKTIKKKLLAKRLQPCTRGTDSLQPGASSAEPLAELYSIYYF